MVTIFDQIAIKVKQEPGRKQNFAADQRKSGWNGNFCELTPETVQWNQWRQNVCKIVWKFWLSGWAWLTENKTLSFFTLTELSTRETDGAAKTNVTGKVPAARWVCSQLSDHSTSFLTTSVISLKRAHCDWREMWWAPHNVEDRSSPEKQSCWQSSWQLELWLTWGFLLFPGNLNDSSFHLSVDSSTSSPTVCHGRRFSSDSSFRSVATDDSDQISVFDDALSPGPFSAASSTDDSCFFPRDFSTQEGSRWSLNSRLHHQSVVRSSSSSFAGSSSSLSPSWEETRTSSLFGTLPRKSRKTNMRKHIFKLIPGLQRSVEEEETGANTQWPVDLMINELKWWLKWWTFFWKRFSSFPSTHWVLVAFTAREEKRWLRKLTNQAKSNSQSKTDGGGSWTPVSSSCWRYSNRTISWHVTTEAKHTTSLNK